MIHITPTLTATGAVGNTNDALAAIDAKFKEPFLKPYLNLDFENLAKDYTFTFDNTQDEAIEYGTTSVYMYVKGASTLIGVPNSLPHLIDLANNLDIAVFRIDADGDIRALSFVPLGAMVQNDMPIFQARSIATTTYMATQGDINRELAFQLAYTLTRDDLRDLWINGGNELTGPGQIGSTNNQPVSIIVDGVEMWECRVNGSIHRSNKLFTIAYSDTNTSWGHANSTALVEEDAQGNTGVGADGLLNLERGNYNSAFGTNSLKMIVDEESNSAFGYNSGHQFETGKHNLFAGSRTGTGLTIASGVTLVGASATSTTDSIHSSIALGYNSEIDKSNQFVVGAVPDGDGWGAVKEVLYYYTATKTHGEFFLEASPQGVVTAQRGSIAYVNDGSDGSAWLKTGATISSWEQIQTTTALEIPNREIVYGTGTTITSNAAFTFNDSTKRLSVNGNAYFVDTAAPVTDSIIKLQNISSTFFIYASNATPLSVISAPRSSIALVDDTSTGSLYVKRTTTGTGGWAKAIVEGAAASLSFTFLSGEGLDTDSGGAAIFNLGATNAKVINLGTGAGNTNINIGTSGTNTIVIGNSNSTLSFVGSVINESVTNHYVSDKLITLNDGGAAASGSGVGIEIEENAVITGYIKVTGGRDGYLMKAPGNAAESSFIFLASVARTYTFPDVSGTVITTGDTGTVTNAMLAGSIDDSKISSATTWSAKGYDLSAQCANGITLTNGVTNYVAPFFGNSSNATESNRQISVKVATTCSRLYIRTSSAQPGTGSLVVTVRKNGADTAITLTITAGGAAGTFTDLVNTVSFAAGDLLSIKIVNNASSTSATIMEVGVFMQ